VIRSIVVTLLVLGGPRVFASIPSPQDSAAVAEWFAEVLRAGDPREIAPAMEPGTWPRAWREVRDLFGRHECISAEPIDSSTTWLSEDLALVRVRLRAAATTRAAWHPRFELPDRWQLELHKQPDGVWRLRSAMTDERSAALCMIADSTEGVAERTLSDAAADPLRTISNYATEATEPEQAQRFVPLMEHARVLARGSGSAAAESDVLQQYARFCIYRSVPGALDRAQEALELARTSDDPEILAGALLRVGSVHVLQQRFEEALTPLNESASLVESLNDPVIALKALYMLGHALGPLNRHFEDLRAREQLLLLSRRYGWREGEEVAAFGKAMVLYKLGKLEATAALLREVATLAQANGSSDHAALAYHDLANVYTQQRRLDLAVASQQQAVAVAPPGTPDRNILYSALASYQVTAGRLDEAEQTLLSGTDVLRSGDDAAWGFFLLPKSMLQYRSGRMNEALENARASFERFARLPASGQFQVQALTLAARALRALGRRDDAIETLRSAIDIAEAERRHAGLAQANILVFERQLAPFLELVNIFLEQEDTIPAALRVAEEFKARELLEINAGKEADLSRAFSAEEREREKTFEARVTEGNRILFAKVGSRESREKELAALNAARVELESFRSQMRLEHPRVAQRDVGIPAQLSLPDADAVEFVVTEERTIAFIVPSAASGRPIRAIAIPITQNDLATRIERYLRALSSRSFGYREEASALYATLIAPVAPYVRGDGPLTIVPDGALWSLPFQTLIAPGGTHLAEQRPIVIAPSLAILHTQRPRRDGRATTLLAFGNPNIGGTAKETVRAAAVDIPLSSLPEAEAEVRMIARLYDGGTVHVGNDATESKFKLESSKYRVLHLATHGFVASGAPLYSGLVFSGDAANDGILEAREVADMKLDADLAVLSACDTGAGEISGGEGVVGLSWAFLAAGCPTTVVSQWKADSAATARLMIELHRQLRRRHTPAEALRRAQLSLIRSEAHWHPYYWAPFIVVGRNDVIGH